MIRIVLDANIFISALLKPGSHPDAIVRLVREGKLLLVTSIPICTEILRVLKYPKIRKRLNSTDAELAAFIDMLASVAVVTAGTLVLPPLEADPDDTKYLACAVEGAADYIISGDHHLTDLGTFRGIRIVEPAFFIGIWNR